MFCRKCGEVLLDDDRFCPFCGAKVIERKREDEVKTEEDVVYTNSNKNFFSETLKPNWNIEDFPNTESMPKKTGDILVDWEKNKLLTPEVIEALTSKQGDVSIIWNKETEVVEDAASENESVETEPVEKEVFETESTEGEEIRLDDIEETKEPVVPDAIEEPAALETPEAESKEVQDTIIFERVKPIQEVDEEKQKFYTFSQKNEEFQKLLDKEYERIKASKESVAKQIESLEAETNAQVQENLEEIKETSENIEEIAISEAEGKVENPETEAQIETFAKEESEVEIQSENQSEIQIQEGLESEDGEGNVHVKVGELEVITEEPPAAPKVNEEDAFEWKHQLPPFEDEKTEKKLSAFAIVLGVIVLVLGISTLILTVEQFSPNSTAGKIVHQIMEKGRSFFSEEDASTMFIVAQSEEARLHDID